MSIYAYTGMPGSGKSYNAVDKVILPALRGGRRVVTNVPLYEDRIREAIPTGQLVVLPVGEVAQDPELIRKFVTPGTVFVLDEVWRLWPAGEKANKTPEAYRSLLAEHRHMVDEQGNAVAVTLIVQDLANIGSFARRLVEQTFIHTKLTHVGASSRFRVDIFHGPVTGAVGPQTNRLREIFGRYDEEVWKFYKSNTMAQRLEDGANEKHIDGRGNVLRRPILVVGALAVPLLIAFGLYGVSHFVHARAVSADSVSAVRAGPNPASGSAAVPVPKPPATGVLAGVAARAAQVVKPAPPPYHVVGYVINNDHPGRSVAVLRGNGGEKITRPFDHCRRIVGEPLQCELEGVFYSETGMTVDAEVHKPL
jgi:zona occludens toxin